MKVVFLDPVGTLGGAERSLIDLMASLRDAAPSLRVGLIVGADGPLVTEAERLGVEVRVLPLPPGLSRTGDSGLAGLGDVARRAPALVGAAADLAVYGARLRGAILALEPTLVHSNGMKMHLLAALLPMRAPVVWHMRDFVGQRPIMARVLRAVASRPAALVAISRSVADDAARALGAIDATVVYNAIDTLRFAPGGARDDLDALAGLPRLEPGEPVVRVGLVATYARWKGHELLLDAAARVARETRRVRFYVIGGPMYETVASQYTRDELLAAIDARGLRGVAGLVPFRESPERAYRALDVAVHASTRPEPFGRTIAEAMACGVTAIVANEGGAAELVTDDVDAIAIPPRDAGALSGAITALVADPDRRARIGALARSAAVARFSRERLGPEVLAVYERVLSAATR